MSRYRNRLRQKVVGFKELTKQQAKSGKNIDWLSGWAGKKHGVDRGTNKYDHRSKKVHVRNPRFYYGQVGTSRPAPGRIKVGGGTWKKYDTEGLNQLSG